MTKRAWATLGGSAVLISLVVSACGGNSLPCPIPQDLMENPPEDAVALTFQNDSCTTICSLNISPRSCDNWGLDWLGNANIPSGEARTLLVPPGQYDILVEDCTQAEYQYLRFSMEEDRAMVFTATDLESIPSCSTSLTIQNNTSQPVCHLWISAPYSESFGLNWLGDDEIPPGASLTVTVPPGVYDLKAEDCAFNIQGLELDTEVSGDRLWVLEP